MKDISLAWYEIFVMVEQFFLTQTSEWKKHLVLSVAFFHRDIVWEDIYLPKESIEVYVLTVDIFVFNNETPLYAQIIETS